MNSNDVCTQKEEKSSHFALHVALQTMKERCQNLQRRLTSLEDENLNLKMNASSFRYDEEQTEQTEAQQLKEKVSELSRQKSQLMEHLSLVASENRTLWSRLSQITKDNDRTFGIRSSDDSDNAQHQNLSRSKTFTQSAPNPKLREKLHDLEDDTMEMEDVSLLKKCGYIDARLKQEDSDSECDDTLIDLENNVEAKKCTDGLIDIQKELVKQQFAMKSAIVKMKTVKEVCNSCKNKKPETKPQTADKSLSTENDLFENILEGEFDVIQQAGPTDIKNIDLLQEKSKADGLDKMCPMCGKIYVKNTTFDDFQEHVESHFVDDHDFDMSLDRNYEYYSQTVGNF